MKYGGYDRRRSWQVVQKSTNRGMCVRMSWDCIVCLIEWLAVVATVHSAIRYVYVFVVLLRPTPCRLFLKWSFYVLSSCSTSRRKINGNIQRWELMWFTRRTYVDGVECSLVWIDVANVCLKCNFQNNEILKKFFIINEKVTSVVSYKEFNRFEN